MYIVWMDEKLRCGESTELVDADGNRLAIGDIVTVDAGISFVFADEDGPFVMGIQSSSQEKDFGRHIVVLKTKHSVVQAGTVVGDAKYVGSLSLMLENEIVGSCGVGTDLRTANGARLSVGDQIIAISPNTKTVSVAVVVSRNGKPYIHGMKDVCDKDGYDGWRVVGWKGFENAVVGEKCGSVTYV